MAPRVRTSSSAQPSSAPASALAPAPDPLRAATPDRSPRQRDRADPAHSAGEGPTKPRPEHALRIEQLPLAALTPWARNARTHSKSQLRQLAQSIETFGWTNPVLVDGSGTILAGHGRVEAARMLGLTSVPCVRLEHMTPAQKRAYVLADNKLALNAGWDDQLLGEELAALMGLDNLSFDLSVTGFSIAEVDHLVEGLSPEEPGDPEDDVVPEQSPRRVQLGDVWQLGPHRLVCGDALDPEVVALLMAGPDGQDREQARMIFSDPPYNVPIEGHVLTRRKGKGGQKDRGGPSDCEGDDGGGKTGTAARTVPHPEFAMAAGEMTRAEFTAFLTTAFRNMANHAVDGSIHFLCMDWRHVGEMLEAGEAVYSELKNLIVWAKDNGGMGSFYRSRHELVLAFKKGSAPHVNSFELGQHGRYRTNVWQYRGVNTRRAGRMEELALHPTCKPVQMIADAIKDVSARGEIVLDLFGGSGSTLIAAQKTGRRARLVELDPVYCDRILARWEAFAQDEAELIERRTEASPGSASAATSLPAREEDRPEPAKRTRSRKTATPAQT